MVDKGGCKEGRKKEPKGGCKVGKKKVEPKKKIKLNVIKPGKKEETKEKKAPAPPAPKKKKMKLNVVKRLPKKEPPKAKKVKLNVVKRLPPKPKTPSPKKTLEQAIFGMGGYSEAQKKGQEDSLRFMGGKPSHEYFLDTLLEPARKPNKTLPSYTEEAFDDANNLILAPGAGADRYAKAFIKSVNTIESKPGAFPVKSRDAVWRRLSMMEISERMVNGYGGFETFDDFVKNLKFAKKNYGRYFFDYFKAKIGEAPSPPQVKLTPKQEEEKKKVLKERKDEPFMYDMWDEEVQKIWEKTGRSFKKLPRRLEDDRVLYYHDFFNTDGSTTLSKRKTKNYNIPVYIDPNNGYSVGKSRWRDYSWVE
jgi:hypothetical protein